MNYNFPTISHIDQIKTAIHGRDEFIIDEREIFDVVNYIVQKNDTFPPADKGTEASILRECRGLIFDKTGKIVARGYHKFFNVDEKEEVFLSKIDLSKPHKILEKLDGSMIRPLYLGYRQIRWMTKMGVTEISMMVENFVTDNPQYEEFVTWLNTTALLEDDGLSLNQHTPIFEFCSRKNRIVIDYPEDKLILTAIRDNITGQYITHDKLIELGDTFNIPVVKAFDGDLTTMEALIEHTRGLEDAEGYVLRFDDGHMIKIKADLYVRIHKVKENLAFEYNFANLVLNEQWDDVVSMLPDQDKQPLLQYKDQLLQAITDIVNEVYEFHLSHNAKVYDRKTFAIEHSAAPDSVKLYPLMLHTIFKLWDIPELTLNDVYNIIIERFKQNTNRQITWIEFKTAIPQTRDIKWITQQNNQ